MSNNIQSSIKIKTTPLDPYTDQWITEGSVYPSSRGEKTKDPKATRGNKGGECLTAPR